MSGWIVVDRKIMSNVLWTDAEPFDKRSAWIDLLLLANHKDHELIHRGKIITVKRGEVNRSVLQLANRWHWSRNKTLRFLRTLSEASMITRESTTDGTTITIENYNKYQFTRSTDGTSNGTTGGTTDVTSSGTTDGTYTKKNNKDIKNESTRDNNFFHYETNADRAGMSLKDFIKAKTKGEVK